MKYAGMTCVEESSGVPLVVKSCICVVMVSSYHTGKV